MRMDDGRNDSCVVKRQTRVSTECHPDIMMEEFFGLSDDIDDIECQEDDSDDEEDFLMAILEAKASQKST